MPETADLVIVGAGTVGGWASVLAREAGLERVVVLEAGRAGAGSSSRASGMVRTQGGTGIAVDLGCASVDFYETQRERYGIDSGFRQLGYLIYAFDEEDRAAASQRLAMHAAKGLPSRWVEPDELAGLAPMVDPEVVIGATHCPRDGAIDPPRNVLAYVTAMREGGVELREGTPAVEVLLDGASVTGVRTSAGTIATDRVILAGGWAQTSLLPVGCRDIPVGAARHSVLVTAPVAEFAGDVAMGWDLAGPYWRQEEGGVLFGWSDPDETPGLATEIDWGQADAIRRRMGELVPCLRGVGLRRAWAATIDFTPDHLPIVGEALTVEQEPVAGLSLASAAGHGMMWGPAVARIAVDLATTGQSSVTDTDVLGLGRFDDEGHSRLAADPIALPFPTRA